MKLVLLAAALWILLLLLAAAQVSAAADKESAQSKLHSELAPRPYTFDDYMADLTRSARKDEPKAANPVTEEQSKQVASNKYKNYKPLNPFVVEWWAARARSPSVTSLPHSFRKIRLTISPRRT
jgi:hypothetical protein